MKKLLTLITLFITASLLVAQTVTVTPYGVSPRDVAEDETGVLTTAYNGLLNVGVETQMYLLAAVEDGDITQGYWTLVQKPVGSNADFNIGIVDTDAETDVIIFTPDIAGTYVVSFTLGQAVDQVTINAGTYVGIEDGQCANCHSGYAAAWEGTGHADMLERGLNGVASSHYGENCISCHTVGYDTNADNEGFDDREFVFPDELVEGTYDAMVTAYPEAMKLANIQCESCHGPGSAHYGNVADNKMVADLQSDNCAWCHDSGTHHVFPYQWDFSVHASGNTLYSGSRTSCSPCHNGQGFVQWMKGEEQNVPDAIPITCATCHDPHSAENPHQVRSIADVELGSGDMVTHGGNGKLCMNCHKSRRDAIAYTTVDFSYSSHYGPHHGPQADMLAGKNVPTFGVNLPSSPHLQALENACVDCHMAPGGHDGIPTSGGHTFSMFDDQGVANVEPCVECHGEIGENFAEKKYYMNGVADHDGDGVDEGLQEEIEGMLEELALMLPPYDELDVDVSGTYEYNDVEKQAAYNYLFVEEDRSLGVHNPAFAVSLLKATLEALEYGAITAGDMQSVTDIPMDQGYQVRVVWTAFGADDGVARDQVTTYAVLREVAAGAAPVNGKKYTSLAQIPVTETAVGSRFSLNNEMWDVVAEVPAFQFLEYATVVPTLENNVVGGDTAWTNFKVIGKTESGIVAETAPMAGYSVDNLVPVPPAGFLGTYSESTNQVELVWEESEETDFQYFAVYRSNTEGFVPSEESLLATTVAPSYIDATVSAGNSYYYKVAAFDFAGNQGETTAEVPIIITNLVDMSGIPTEYSLLQNYPNPFNPTTEITFGLPKQSDVKVTIYNTVGKQVAVLVDRQLAAGYHQYTFSASNLATGVYFYEIKADNFHNVKKMLLVK